MKHLQYINAASYASIQVIKGIKTYVLIVPQQKCRTVGYPMYFGAFVIVITIIVVKILLAGGLTKYQLKSEIDNFNNNTS